MAGRKLELEEVREEVLRGKALDIAVGTPLQVQIGSEENGLRLPGALVGFEAEQYLLLRLPSNPGIRRKLREGIPVVARYLYSGTVYGFNSVILNCVHKPALIIFLSYPRTVEVMNLRKAKRLECLLPASAKIYHQKLDGVIMDISVEGCRFHVESADQELPTFHIGQEIIISLKLVGIAGVQIATGRVQNVRQEGGLAEMGIRFDESDTILQKNVESYVSGLLKLNLPGHALR